VCTPEGSGWLIKHIPHRAGRKEVRGRGEDAGYMVRLVASSVKARMWRCGVSNIFASFKVPKCQSFKASDFLMPKFLNDKVPKRPKRQPF
jgi:hypothetical protein